MPINAKKGKTFKNKGLKSSDNTRFLNLPSGKSDNRKDVKTSKHLLKTER